MRNEMNGSPRQGGWDPSPEGGGRGVAPPTGTSLRHCFGAPLPLADARGAHPPSGGIYYQGAPVVSTSVGQYGSTRPGGSA